MFQFQNGAIKSLFEKVLLDNGLRFQFQNGAIKSLFERPEVDVDPFQFQNGAIKRRNYKKTMIAINMFQFQNGAIKSTLKIGDNFRICCFNSKMVRLREFPI